MTKVSSFDLSRYEKIVENALNEDRMELSMGDCTMSDTDARIAVRALSDAGAFTQNVSIIEYLCSCGKRLT